jgi:hypothetical protein
VGRSSLEPPPVSALEELSNLFAMRPRAADVDGFGDDLARLAAVVRLANILVLAVALAMVPTRLLPAGATETTVSHWPTGQRDLVVVDHTGQEAWETATRTAVAQWNSAGADVRLTWESGDGSCDEQGARITFCLVDGDELEGFVEYQGIMTPSTTDDGHAVAAVVEACGDCGLTAIFRQLVATHEIGHALGLPHNDRFGSVMFPNGGVGELDALDGADLRRLYAHDD